MEIDAETLERHDPLGTSDLHDGKPDTTRGRGPYPGKRTHRPCGVVPSTLSPLAKDEDDIYLVIHDTKEQDTLAYPLGKRGIPGTKEIPLHKDFTPANCVAYAFALSPVNTRASVSKYTNIILE